MRGKQAPKREIKPDAIHNSVDVAKFINYIMQDGKKATAQSLVYKAMDKLAADTGKTAIEAFDTAIENVKPKVEVRSKRVGGSNYQVPVPVNEGRQFALASRWIIDGARSGRGSKEFFESLARELTDAFNGEGNAVRKKEDVRKMAEANKAFAQFA